VSTKS